MGFNRTPHYTRGLLLVGDAGGMVNPFNGEGISCAMESGEIAAQVIIQSAGAAGRASLQLALQGCPRALKDAYGGYYTLGRKFVRAIGHPWFMQFATRHGLPR
jgi:flavin-dependent dehydrogenase